MKPPAVAVDFGEPLEPHRNSDDFEEISYPQHHHQYDAEELPLHNMSSSVAEGEARRRVPVASTRLHPEHDEKAAQMHYDDEGKDVYSKLSTLPMRPPPMARMSSGRVYRHPPPPTSIREFILQNMDIIPPLVYTLLSCYTRFHRIGTSDIVVWDEAHFGKFGTHYLKQEFYFDVHPPLGKMLVGLAGLLSGYDGSFDFKSGEKYPAGVPYVAMRVMLACFGVGMVPLAWFTTVELGMSEWACHLVTLMVLFDVGWLVISRFILLDSMLLFFTFLTVFCLTKFHNQQYQSFSIDWWIWLVMTGLSIGWVSSVKLIGLFVTALVGLYTIEDLWNKFGDLRMSYREQARHWLARIACLIILPILVFMFCFKIHFLVLNHSGPGDAQMSSLFQANLVGNDFHKNPLDIAFGSKLTLKNMGWGGGLLHSHVQTYPTGSTQQQVTCYHYKDDNNHWLVLPTWNEPTYDPNAELRYLKDGDVIRLSHAPTTRNLHSHTVPGPVTKTNNEVSCYGNTTVGDHHDYWVVEVVDDIHRGRAKAKAPGARIHSLTTRLRFKHQTLGCYLHAANSILPQWGFKQIEVTCIAPANTSPKDTHTYWNVESHWNDRLPPGEKRMYHSPFLRDFWHLNVAMMTSNNALIPDPDKEDILASKPFDWPFLHLGLRMCGWGHNQVKYYLLGTPIIWWGGTVSLILSLLVLGMYLLRAQRKYTDMTPSEWEHFTYVFKIAFIGWACHYVPFLIMGRVTYLHHYLPTLYFSVLMLGHLLDHFFFSARWLGTRGKIITFAICASSIIGCFWWFRAMAWGMEGPVGDYWGMGWRKSWNIYDKLG